MTRILANPHALASQVLYAASMAATTPDRYQDEIDRRLHGLVGLTDWERAQVRREVSFRIAVTR